MGPARPPRPPSYWAHALLRHCSPCAIPGQQSAAGERRQQLAGETATARRRADGSESRRAVPCLPACRSGAVPARRTDSDVRRHHLAQRQDRRTGTHERRAHRRPPSAAAPGGGDDPIAAAWLVGANLARRGRRRSRRGTRRGLRAPSRARAAAPSSRRLRRACHRRRSSCVRRKRTKPPSGRDQPVRNGYGEAGSNDRGVMPGAKANVRREGRGSDRSRWRSRPADAAPGWRAAAEAREVCQCGQLVFGSEFRIRWRSLDRSPYTGRAADRADPVKALTQLVVSGALLHATDEGDP